jgi:hypothetical protein
LSPVSAAHFCASTLGTDADAARDAAGVVISLDVVDAAKLTIANNTPPEQRSKARKIRGLKTPD